MRSFTKTHDRELAAFLKEVELPFATRVGKPDLGGRYVGGLPEEVFHHPLLGVPATHSDGTEGRISILRCVCAEPG